MTPTVSVVIPVFNQGSFLREAVLSVAEQSVRSWECIIINDGSTDDTARVAQELAAQDSRIRVFSQPNRGLSAARNRGVSLASGEFVQFLDADDLLERGKCEAQLSVLKASPNVGVCYSNFRLVRFPSGENLPDTLTPTLGENPLFDFLFRWERGLSIPIHCALFRRSLWEGSEVFDEELSAKIDWPFWVRLAASGTRFHYLDREWAIYRLHGANMHRRPGPQNALAFARAAAIIMESVPAALQQAFVDATYDHVKNYEAFQARISETVGNSLSPDLGNGSRPETASPLEAFPNRILFELYLRMNRRQRSDLADVSTPEARLSFLRWALDPHPETPSVSRFLRTLYLCRPDVMAAFPDVEGADRSRFLEWARTTGSVEMEYDQRLTGSEQAE